MKLSAVKLRKRRAGKKAEARAVLNALKLEQESKSKPKKETKKSKPKKETKKSKPKKEKSEKE